MQKNPIFCKPIATHILILATFLCAVSKPYDVEMKEIIQHILDTYPGIINSEDNDGNTALHIAIKHLVTGTIEAKLKQLVEGGVNKNIKNEAGLTPLEYLEEKLKWETMANKEAIKKVLS